MASTVRRCFMLLATIALLALSAQPAAASAASYEAAGQGIFCTDEWCTD